MCLFVYLCFASGAAQKCIRALSVSMTTTAAPHNTTVSRDNLRTKLYNVNVKCCRCVKMSSTQAEGVIRNIIREIARTCLSRGQTLSETLIAFMVSDWDSSNVNFINQSINQPGNVVAPAFTCVSRSKLLFWTPGIILTWTGLLRRKMCRNS